MDRHAGGALPPHLRGRPVSGTEAAHANEYFEHFLNATTLKNILGYHRSMCELLHLKPNVFPHFYPKLRACLTSWKAKALWKKFDSRISHKCYGKGKTCTGTRVLVIGAGPCGLRTAIEAQLLGAKVVVVEKRDRLSRNNVLHLWPFVIEDLRMLGAKKFFGKFCAGAIDHISIRQLQCVLLKVALLLGVELHTEVSFEGLIEPGEKIGWRAEVKPSEHPVAQYEFDVIIGADGKRNTLQGFKRKEFRGKLAIAITANFINKKTEAEARVEEISGVAFIFNQKFFKDLQAETRIDLENIVYYKDDTHYFVMTAKKHSLLEKGVIKRDLSDTEKLLAPDNVDRDALQNYAREAADFSTNYQLPELEFAVNHYGQPDVAMFDFTSMYAAEYASKVIERHGTRLLMILVGDSLLEPFWPTGSGCARGFLSSLDAAWAIRSYCSGQMTPLDVLAERESIYRLLAQTTPDNLNKDWKAYTLDPATRYPNLNKSVVTPLQTICLYDTDNPESIEKMKRASLDSMGRQLEHGVPKKRRRGNVDVDVVLTWLREQLRAYDDVTVTDLVSVFRPGKALAAVLHHYRPDLLDYVAAIKNNHESSAAQRNQLAMDIFDKELGVPLFMTAEEITNTDDFLSLTTYLTQIYDLFRGEIPHVKHPKLEQFQSSATSEKFPKNSPENQVGDVYSGSRKVEKVKALLKNLRVKTRSEARDDLAAVNAVKIGKKSLRTLRKAPKMRCEARHTRSEKSVLGNREKPEFFDFTYNEPTTGGPVNKLKKVKSRNVSLNVNLLKMPLKTEKRKKFKRKSQQLSVIPETLWDGENLKKTAETVKVERKDACAGPGRLMKPLRCETFVHASLQSVVPSEELPETSNKRSEFSFKTIKTTSGTNSRHKRHVVDVCAVKQPSSLDRKQRKRRTLDRIGPTVEERQNTLQEIAANRQDRQNKRKQQRQRQTEQFVKSMQMLQTNRKSDQSEPFEDYSIFLYRQTAPKFRDRVQNLEKQFTYVPDYDTKLTGLRPPTNTNAEEDIASKIKSLEDKWSNRQPAEKKPRDLMRAIGKIETSDWNIKQIEKKILENKMGKPPSTLNMDKERVPRWSREEFKARQTKMEKKHLDRQESGETKYADIDRNIKQLDLKLREGTNRELGQNKVASITEKLVKKTPQISEKPEKVTQPKPVNLPVQNGSEYCHFCSKRVYLMERLSAEGRFFHHGCFKCQYCHTQLRLGSYMFDRDGQFGYRFYCIHHFGMHGELPRPTKVARKPSQKGGREVGRSPQKKALSGVAGVDLLDRVQTPERIEFSNLSASGNISSDHEEPLSQMDEDEWTDKNFGASANELDDSEDDSSSLSDTDSDDEDAFDDALEQPMTREGTLKLAQIVRNTHRKGRNHSASDGYSSSEQSSYYENSSDDSDSDTATEGEDEIKARELRRREVLVEAPPAMPETETDTEMASEDETSTSESSRPNSATEISTDSEFAQDDATPTRERKIDDFYVTKRRGAGTASGHANRPKRLQITAAYAQQPLKVVRAHAPAEPPKRALNAGGYALNRTQSTGGIAAKVSLELKKKYLLGDAVGGGIQKSGSASALEVKFKSFHTAIEDCQRRLLTRKELPPPDLTRACLEIPRVEVHSAEEERKSDEETRDLTAKSGREEDRKEQEEEATSTSNRTEATTCRTNWNEADTSRTNRKEEETFRSNRDEETSSRTNWKEEENSRTNWKEEETSRTDRNEDASSRISWKEGATGRTNWKEADNTRTNREEETTERTNSNEEETPCRTNGREAETSTINWKEEESSRTNRDKEASSRINWNETETSRSNWKEAESSRTNWKEEATSTSNRKEADKEETSRTNERVEEQSSTRKEEAVCSTNRKEAETDFVTIRKGAETGRNNRDEETLTPTNWNEAETSRSNRDEEASSRTSWNEDVTGRTNWNEAETSRTNRKETRKSEKKQLNQPKSLPDLGAGGLRLACHVPRSSPEGETEQSDWAQDSFDSLELGGAQAHNFHPLATAATPHLDLDSLEYIDRSPPTANAAAAPPDDYRQHCQRLRGQVGFGNARDSLDLRKSRTKPDLLLLPPPSSTRYSKQRIERERDATRQVIEQMVMDKMKRLENETGRRKQLRNSTKPDLLGSPPLSVFAPRPPPRRPKSHTDETRDQIETSRQQRTQSHPDEARNQFETQSRRERTDLHPHETRNDFETQPRQQRTKSHPDEALKQVETQSKQRPDEARKRIETPQSKQRQRPKSVQELKMAEAPSKWCRSDSNLAEEPNAGGERRKSFGKMIAGIFYKKIAKFSPRSKSKSLTSLDLRKHEAAINEPRKCASQLDVQRGEVGEITPPPIPPLPANYTLKDESSDEGLQDRTSCDALDQSGAGNAELPSGAKRSGKSRRQSRQAQLKRHRMAQEIQRKLEETEVKMRELELRGVQVEKALRGEEEKEEEARDRCAKDENLLQEWFDLMRDRCELRRYERELTVRAQELELEDRHARLQNELREKLENCVRKTEDDVRAEQTIIDQMMDIVAKRDSLITVLEEDRLKYSHEDKDLEEQMLAKGLLLTPIRKSAGKID